MRRLMRVVMRIVVVVSLAVLCGVALRAQDKSTDRPGGEPPKDAGAAKLFAKAMKEWDDRKFALSLEDFRKADQMDGGHCLACELNAYMSAKQVEDYAAARQEAGLVLGRAGTAEEKSKAHVMLGDVCLAEGGFKIFQKPFEDADKEFGEALELLPGNSECLYSDGVALAHLHQYGKATERFEQYVKQAPPSGFNYSRAKLFTTQPELARKRTAPEFKVTTLDGKTISMDQLAGKVVLIDFWSTWCGPCKQALPHLKELISKFDGQPLVVVSVSLDQDENTWKYYVQHNGMTWAQYRDGGFDGPIARQFRVKAIPTTFTVDTNGFVQDQQVGDGNIEDKLLKLLAGVKP